MPRPMGSGFDERAFPVHILAEEIVPYLERDHARALVALLMYGTLTAVEEGRLTLDTAYRVVLNWPTFLYFRDWLKPRDRILVRALSESTELDSISSLLGEQAVPATCARIKARLAPWLTKHLQGSPASGNARSGKSILHTDIPLAEMVLPCLGSDRARTAVALLMYGTLRALEEGRITIDVANRAVFNQHVLIYLKENLRPRDRTLEKALLLSLKLDATKRRSGRPVASPTFTKIRDVLVGWLVRHLQESPIPGPTGSQKILSYVDMPLDMRLLQMERDHARTALALLIYGTVTALEQGRITVTAAGRIVLNNDVYSHVKERLRPRDRILEEALSYSAQLFTLGGDTARRQDIRRVCAKIKARLTSQR
jgi:hypothetical protein